MKPSIRFTKVSSGDDLIEFRIEVSDGRSLFSNNVYVAKSWLKDTIDDLKVFRKQVHQGIYDLKAGAFGPEYASGGFQARLHFQGPGILFISSTQQSEFSEFKKLQVASDARLYLQTEPILLDHFIEDLARLQSDEQSDATLQCA